MKNRFLPSLLYFDSILITLKCARGVLVIKMGLQSFLLSNLIALLETGKCTFKAVLEILKSLAHVLEVNVIHFLATLHSINHYL